jgi:hypothetical protein
MNTKFKFSQLIWGKNFFLQKTFAWWVGRPEIDATPALLETNTYMSILQDGM